MAVPSLLAPPLRQNPPAPPVVPPAAPVTTDAHAADRPDFVFTLEPTMVAGYEIRPSGLTPGGQTGVVTPAGGSDRLGLVSLERPGSMDDDDKTLRGPGGRRRRSARTCEIEIPGDVIIIDFFGLAPTEIEQLIAGLIVADPTDPTTWFSSLDALP